MRTHSPESSNACQNPCEPSSHGLRPGDAISDARRQRVGATRSCKGIVAAPATPGSSTSLASNPSDPGHRLETVQRPSGDDATSASLGRRPVPCPLHFPPPLGSFEHRPRSGQRRCCFFRSVSVTRGRRCPSPHGEHALGMPICFFFSNSMPPSDVVPKRFTRKLPVLPSSPSIHSSR